MTTAETPATIELRSDNSACAASYILDAIVAANTGSALAYGDDDWTHALHRRIANVFECDEVSVFPVGSGTAANALALSAICPPWGAVLGHHTAHVLVNEAAATSMFSGGAALFGIDGPQAKIDVKALSSMLDETNWGDPHRSQPSVLTLTQPTDFGTVYTPAELGELAATARERGMKVHLDGARLANAIAALGCAPADVTWRAGVDVLSLGAIKNGALSTDAIVCFDQGMVEPLGYRLKRAGHTSSKMRFQSVQLDAYLTDGRWLETAGSANAMMARLVDGLAALGIEPALRPEVNIVYLDVDPAFADRLETSGLLFYRIGPGTIRFVTSFATTTDEIDDAISRTRICLAD